MSRDAIRKYISTHWGLKPTAVYEYDEPLYPAHLTGMGKLRQLVFQPGVIEGKPRRGAKERTVGFEGRLCILAFTVAKPERLYIMLPKSDQKVIAREFYRPGKGICMLDALHQALPGRQGDYPFRDERGRAFDLPVRPLGVLTDISYFTEKKGDGPSTYVHALGEETHQYPVLCTDAEGHLWIAGGNYTVPAPGITD